ncbi:MAG: Gfo/Idh/MocA family oxidoreductase [candidate division KSB1 bacterium]|nr:Gfo/Idh/MocA family oxidoreductase [candidate division KSB1 bacterium]MDZ7302234.1 Gfo/Idh/MocA family oxidoreductase [candidate division KSB1 bacterium]MDZ7311340.1 Gfo/Idh/MocA family oxidoreductase [candidate division KSB1 bacterium]
MEKVRVAIIGAGWIAQVAHIPVWKKLENVELVAVCDTVKARARVVAEKFKIPQYFTRDEELLKREDIDAVDICVPTNLHERLTVESLSAGKHVLVEKPMSRTAEEAEKMVRAANQYQRNLMVAMNMRFRYDATNLKSFIDGGEIGEVFYAKAGWLRRQKKLDEQAWLYQKKYSGGGVLMDLGVQVLDVILWLLGNPKAKSVKANTYDHVANFEVEDTAVALVHLDNGITVNLEASWIFLQDEDLFYAHLLGTRGNAQLNPLRVTKELHGNLVNLTPSRPETPTNLYKQSYQNELRHFIRCLREGTPMLSTGEESLERMRLVEGMYESAKCGKEVAL